MPPKCVRKSTISELQATSRGIFIVGIIIRKQNYYATTPDASSGKSSWLFTIRDSVSDIINTTVYGSEHYVKNLSSRFQTGDVVDVIDPFVLPRAKNDYRENYKPFVTSKFTLIINQNQAVLSLHENDDRSKFFPLLHVPTKAIDDFSNLSDIHASVKNLNGQYVNVRAVVRDIGPKKTLTTKAGKNTEVVEVYLMDQTSPLLVMEIWDCAILSMASKWIPRQTILFVADVRVKWNDYQKSAVIVVKSRTVITVDPQMTNTTDELRSYATTAVLEPILSLNSSPACNPNTITTVMSCQAVHTKLRETACSEFSALVYAVVHKLDIDSAAPVSFFKCSKCHKKIPRSSKVCVQCRCFDSGVKKTKLEPFFDISIRLADHTGSLPFCRLNEVVARKIFKCGVNDFLKLPSDKKTELKWQYLFKTCAVKLVVSSNKESGKSFISVVSLDRVSISEYAKKIAVR